MILVISSTIALLLLGAAIITRAKESGATETINTELSMYYEMETNNVGELTRQLAKAAKISIMEFTEHLKKMEIIEKLHGEGLVSDGYYYGQLKYGQNLAIEKMMIENEAESIKEGYKDVVYNEARKINLGSIEKKKVHYFDCELYNKRQEVIRERMLKMNECVGE